MARPRHDGDVDVTALIVLVMSQRVTERRGHEGRLFEALFRLSHGPRAYLFGLRETFHTNDTGFLRGSCRFKNYLNYLGEHESDAPDRPGPGLA